MQSTEKRLVVQRSNLRGIVFKECKVSQISKCADQSVYFGCMSKSAMTAKLLCVANPKGVEPLTSCALKSSQNRTGLTFKVVVVVATLKFRRHRRVLAVCSIRVVDDDGLPRSCSRCSARCILVVDF